MRIRRFFYILTHWEKWHYHVKYIPLYPVWLWFCLRSKSFWFFTPSNPTLTFGGFEGESKQEMYRQLPEGSYPRSIYISPGLSFDELITMVQSERFTYPFAVKPDVGMMGFLFRVMENEYDLEQYHQMIPCDYIIQELVEYPIEVSVFYYRYPYQHKGHITGFVRKEMLEVIGDGRSTLDELLKQFQNRPGFQPEEWRTKHRARLNDVIPQGEVFRLSWVANLSRGGRLVNLDHEKDERLLDVFDRLSHYNGNFYYGRYDIKCASIEDLRNGRNFSILEYNGSGAEPHHVYGNGNNLFEAYGILIHHWKTLAAISRYNHKNGIRYWGFTEGLSYLKKAKKHFRLLKQLDRS
ncbi:MAG: hypothetical protein ACJ75F_00175 [Flavisolibacter sp.]|jgi:hypothetical protein